MGDSKTSGFESTWCLFFITQILYASCWIRFLVYFVTVNKFELCFIKKLSPLGKVEQRTLILKVFYWQAFCSVTTVAVKVQRKLFSTTLFFPLFTVLELKSNSCISSASSCMLHIQHFGGRECGALASARHFELKMSKLDKALFWCRRLHSPDHEAVFAVSLQYLCIFHSSDSQIRWWGTIDFSWRGEGGKCL